MKSLLHLFSKAEGCCVTDLTGKFSMSQSTTSHHLGILLDAGIVRMEKRGLWSVYLISPETIQEFPSPYRPRNYA